MGAKDDNLRAYDTFSKLKNLKEYHLNMEKIIIVNILLKVVL